MDKNQPTSQDTPLFEAFFEQTSQPYCVMKADGSLLKANAAFLNHFGYDATVLISHNFSDLLRYDFKSKIVELLATFTQGISATNSILLNCKTASTKSEWYDWSFTKTPSSDLIMATAYNISKHVADKEILKETQRIFNEFVEYSTDLVFFCDKQLKIKLINKEVKQSLGYSEDFMLGKEFSYFIFAEDKLLFSEFHSSSVHNQIISKVIRIIDAANNIRILKLRLIKRYSMHQQSEIIINALDITDLIQLDKEVQQYRYFEELSEFQHNFLSNISNELRSPMNAIMGFNDILLHSNPTTQQLDSIHAVKNASATLMLVIQDIIDFTSVKSGELRIKNNQFQLIEILDRIRNVSQAHAIHKELNFNFDYPHDLPRFVLGDNIRFSQILLNLIGNALNITENGQVTVAVDQIDNGRREFCSLLININYSGSISPKTPNNLSLIKADKEKQEKSDFGFSSTKSLIELLGGSLNFENEGTQKGSFDIRLSFKIGEMPKENEALIINSLKDVKILLVEDSLLNQKLAKKLLQNLNADITVANNGKIALNYLSTERFDVILLDLQMPVMDGFTTIRNIRYSLRLDTPVIAVTGLSQHDEKQRCLNAGMNDYLSKPFKKEDLFRKLYKHLSVQ